MNELVCYRMSENDPRIGAWTRNWQTKGFIFDYPYLPDPVTEKAYLGTKSRFLQRISKITVKDAPNDDVV